MALLILFGGPALLTHAQFLKITEVKTVGNSAVTTESIQDVVHPYLLGNYMFVFSKSNIAIFPKDEIELALRNTFSRFEDVSVSRRSLHEIVVKVTERNPNALWCEDSQKINCFFIDANGLIFDKAGDFSEDIYFIYTGLVIGDPINKYFLSESDFKKANNLLRGLISLDLTPVSFAHIADTSFDITLEGGEHILISMHDDYKKTLSNLESVLRDTSLRVYEDGELTVSSFDARYGNKIVIKRKGL